MRRIPAALAVVALTVALTGCSVLFTSLTAGPGDAKIDVGTCLDAQVKADSDRRSVVDCSEPHLYEVTGIVEWPGMPGLIEESGGDEGEAWDALHVIVGSTGEPAHPEYFDWAETACETATQQVLRIDDVELDGKSAADIWLRLGAGYGVDLSLDTREGFVAGDHRTVCSAAWYDARGNPLSITLGDGITLSDAAGPDFPLDQRECWDDEFYLTTCKVPHAAQVLVGFDGVATLGAELVAKLGNGDGTDSDWEVADTVCDQLLDQTLPSSADFGPDLGYLSEIGVSPGWEAFEGTLDPDQNYPFACVALGDEGTIFEGDVFDGTAAVVEN